MSGSSTTPPAWARVVGGVVQELFTPAAGENPNDLFHPGIGAWVLATAGVAPGWTWDGTSFAAPVPPVRTAAEAVAALGAELAAKQGAGVYFTPTGGSAPVLFPTDPGSRGAFTAAWNAIGANLWADGKPFIAADGTPVPLSTADAKALITKALAYVDGCVDAYAALHAAVVANPAADIAAGWPGNA